MALSFPRRRRMRFPITLSVSLIVLNVALMVCWIVLLAMVSYWSALAIGTIIFAVILVGLVIYTVLTVKEIQLNLRQANFIDSVTHELKTPLASLRLYLETLELRPVEEAKRQEFYRVMSEDVQRLDMLINQLLQIGRLDALVTDTEQEEVELEPLLKRCAAQACVAHQQPLETVKFSVQPVVAIGGQLPLEMIFGNLIENAIKYGATPPEVEVSAEATRAGRILVQISDNGVGVPAALRKEIFGLFFRMGRELERKQKGTGLGLYIVHTLVRKMKGRVSVSSRGRQPGAVFEVELPGRSLS